MSVEHKFNIFEQMILVDFCGNLPWFGLIFLYPDPADQNETDPDPQHLTKTIFSLSVLFQFSEEDTVEENDAEKEATRGIYSTWQKNYYKFDENMEKKKQQKSYAYIFYFARIWVTGWFGKNYDDLLRKNVNIRGKREKRGQFKLYLWKNIIFKKKMSVGKKYFFLVVYITYPWIFKWPD